MSFQPARRLSEVFGGSLPWSLTMAKLRRVGVLFLAKLQAAIMAWVGLGVGIVYSFGGAIYDVASTGSVNVGTALAFFALLGMPILFAAFGFASGAIGAVIYNYTAGWFGGIEMDLEP